MRRHLFFALRSLAVLALGLSRPLPAGDLPPGKLPAVPVPAPTALVPLRAALELTERDFEKLDARIVLRRPDAGDFQAFFAARSGGGAAAPESGVPWDATAGGFRAGMGPISAGAGPLGWTGPLRDLESPYSRDLSATAGRGGSDFALKTTASPISPAGRTALGFAFPAERPRDGIGVGGLAFADADSPCAGGVLGLDWRRGDAAARAEALGAVAGIRADEAEAWFSPRPLKPERRLVLAGLAFSASGSRGALLADAAASDSGCAGRGAYLRLAGEGAAGRARLFAAADAATPRFAGLDGKAPGQRLRAALGGAGPRVGGGRWETRLDGLWSGPWNSSDAWPDEERGASFSLRAALGAAEGESGPAWTETACRLRSRAADPGADRPGRDWEAALSGTFRLGQAEGAPRAKLEAGSARDGSDGKTGVFGGCALDWGTGKGVQLRGGAKARWTGELRLAISAAAALPALGGRLSASLGTDGETAPEKLFACSESSSALGPWTCALSWRLAL